MITRFGRTPFPKRNGKHHGAAEAEYKNDTLKCCPLIIKELYGIKNLHLAQFLVSLYFRVISGDS